MFCPNCGAEQADNVQYCRNCGMRLVQESGTPSGTAYSGAMEYAGFWRRFVAWIIDIVLLNLAGLIVGLIMGFLFTAAGADAGAVTVLAYLVWIIIYWLYYSVMESSSKQATLGKMAMRIIVTDGQGNGISFARATGRLLAKIISTIILLIGYLMIAFTRDKQGLHDMIADTLVVMK